MANSKFEYVKHFETTDLLLPSTWIVVRIDGRGFTKLCNKYGFEKPNDKRALDLMNMAAKVVVRELPDITIAYGVSDEYSFIFHKSCTLFERRASKIVSTVVSTFTANYIYYWSTFFPDVPLSPPLPSFDGRAVCYPTIAILRDYLSWRQADCHINNLFNTTFWALIKYGKMDNKEAEKALAGTLSADKNEILFSQFHINYNNEPEMFKKGSIVFRDYELADTESISHSDLVTEVESQTQPLPQSKSQEEKERKRRAKAQIVVEHLDLIKDEFWEQRPWILSNKPGRVLKET